MSDFKGHVKAGLIFYVGFSIFFMIAFYRGVLPYVNSRLDVLFGVLILSFFMSLIGSMFPDIDHHSSKPFKIFSKVITLLLVGGIIFSSYIFRNQILKYISNQSYLNLPAGLLFVVSIVLVSIFLIVFTPRALRIIQPKHRGITHKMSTGIILSLILGISLYWAGVNISWEPSILGVTTSVSFLMGFISHMYADGLLFEKETYFEFN